jgi:predicted ester cyclase
MFLVRKLLPSNEQVEKDTDMAKAEFMQHWFEEVWNNQNEAAIEEMFAADGVGHGLGPEPIVGPENFKVFHRAFVSAYPDLKVHVEDTVVEGEKIAVRCRVTGSHNGEGIGLTPTNQPVDFTGMVIVRVQDGKIVEAWNEFNFMEMYKQVGALTLNLQ